MDEHTPKERHRKAWKEKEGKRAGPSEMGEGKRTGNGTGMQWEETEGKRAGPADGGEESKEAEESKAWIMRQLMSSKGEEQRSPANLPA